MPLELTITNEQKVHVRINPKSPAGQPAKLDPNNPPKWSAISGDSLVVADPDGLGATLTSSDTPGDSVFLVDGDADLGDGVVQVQDTITLHVQGANAASLGLAADAPELK